MQATPPAGEQDAEVSSGVPEQGVGIGAGTKPVVVTVCLLGVLVTGLCLAAAGRLDRSGTAQVLAVGAVVAALVAVLVAVGGQLAALLGTASSVRRAGRRGVVAVLSAGLLSLLAVLMAGAAALVVVRPGEASVASEPMIVAQRAVAGPDSAITAKITFPGMKAGEVLEAKIESVSEESDSRYVLARAAVLVGVDGPATVGLTATTGGVDEVVVEASGPKARCTVRLPSAGTSEGPAAPVSCTTV
ncbi:hypothetical protein ACFQFC_17075 [Amorphoplanes digitatis]|uniref:4-amino-4-deoxy-L-arabinose transferase-like glycosyltransferase n=1 Tax=Actinoplanes digitatis TaxID=1868 RepID=A0A7W7I3V4_9ACTN|nr:hypothetical protein [Actinoplanes digitatis]MBB4765926.1 4-amino-4-deoxy-L-arabinose transferase-like glycosyltransferase [Actinoplanes digitatis]